MKPKTIALLVVGILFGIILILNSAPTKIKFLIPCFQGLLRGGVGFREI